MKKIKLAVIFGGNSSEYPVSLHSTGSVLSQINKDRYELILIGITRDGEWYHYHGSIEDLEHDHWANHPQNKAVVFSSNSAYHGFLELDSDGTYHSVSVDCIFPILHGKNGEDGTIQGLFELSGIPYVGCGHMSSAICMDKEMTHIICERAGIPCAPYMAVYASDMPDEKTLYEKAEQMLQVPFFIKPCNAGSSFGVHKVHNFEEFHDDLQDAFYHDGRGKVIFEATIDGFEIGCAVMGNDELFAGSVDEIEIKGDLFDYEGKYEMTDSAIYCPARIDQKLFEQAREMAKQAYRAMNCKGLTRVDLFVTNDQRLVFNELNTVPGFTATSRYPTMMKEAGIAFPDLIDRLVDLAMESNKTSLSD